jgi:hypothetical protein
MNIHTRENNPESQANLDRNRPHFTNQCELLLEVLRKGEHLTGRSALLDYGVAALPRRIKDLKENGIPVQSRMIGGGFKEYYLNPIH